MTDDLQRRVADLLHHAVASLDPTDRDERIAYCQQNNQHGVRMHPATDDDLIEFTWGGRTLVMVHRDVLLDDQPLPQPTFIAVAPDTIPDEWTEQ
jgi:phosphoribosylformylglycinamidine (FGAM) synthase-like enzyme